MKLNLKTTKINNSHPLRVNNPDFSAKSVADIKKYRKALADIEQGSSEGDGNQVASFTWFDSFPKKWYNWGRKKTKSGDVAFEIGCQLYNQAVIERNLAFEVRQEDPLKATKWFSDSAQHFRAAASSVADSDAVHLTTDIRPGFLKTLSLLSDADAQETAVDAAILDGVAEDVKAELAQKASWLYADLERISTTTKLLKKTKSSFSAKSAEMEALAQKFQARVCELEGAEASTSSNKHGEAIARLKAAKERIVRSERKRVPTEKTRALKAEIGNTLEKVEKDNKLIYHEKIPKIKEVGEIRARDWKSQFLWEDPDFAPSDANLDHPEIETEWKRPSEIVKDPNFVVDGFSRFDVHQGELGDCWFLAALASLANNEKAFAKTVPAKQGFDESYDGKFFFNLWWKGRPMLIEIDDRLPVVKKYGTYHLRYVKMNDGREFWPALIEKAVAKVVGGYQFLDGGLPVNALEILTGGEVKIHDPMDFADNRKIDELFERLLNAHEGGCIVTCGIWKWGGSDAERRRIETGLLDGHAYSVTDAAKVELTSGGSVCLVRVRNPWGETKNSYGEWKQKWSDKSSEWKNVPLREKQRIRLERDNDGEFWMEIEDFCRQFSTVSICKPR